MTKSITVIDAPSILGLRPTGVELLPDALVRAGLLTRLHARHAERVDLISDYFAMPTILWRCFFCSLAWSMNAATALREAVKPILGAAPSRLR
jgi:hypothetical protein